ncbi:SDR family NAD(P)-dependent oxidoreductase [Mycobacterium sp.]|uniref:SDR family NAD(P)-dependent oxidoreductase n=1 Tax=Mycobacterium sp. TaxID=1785 RepID=UPI003F9C9E40
MSVPEVQRSINGLRDKVVVIAGGATGIGAATAKRLGAEGSIVVVGDLAESVAKQTADDITAAGGIAHAVAFDLAEPDSIRTLFEAAYTAFGPGHGRVLGPSGHRLDEPQSRHGGEGDPAGPGGGATAPIRSMNAGRS